VLPRDDSDELRIVYRFFVSLFVDLTVTLPIPTCDVIELEKKIEMPKGAQR
jgi:hypothetical protein